jgi:hypothetical protein
MATRDIQAETNTPDGRRVMLFEDTWREHITDPREGHPEIEPHLDAVLATVSQPDYHEPDVRAGRERFYKHAAGPTSWLVVVVSFEQEPARIVTAFAVGDKRAPGQVTP